MKFSATNEDASSQANNDDLAKHLNLESLSFLEAQLNLSENSFFHSDPNNTGLIGAIQNLDLDQGESEDIIHGPTVKFLVSRGGRVNTENARFKTPLILATELKYPYDVGMCRLLLDSGAHVNWTTRNRNTVMFSACKFGNLELMEVLLSRGGDLNVQSKDGASPLMHACYYNCLEMVGFLLRHSAQIEMRNLRHETALYIAAFRGHFKIVQLLVSSLYLWGSFGVFFHLTLVRFQSLDINSL